ncbi:hypothetical protein BKA81DRAFT_357790 [Phyllosticta paracitricarpa]
MLVLEGRTTQARRTGAASQMSGGRLIKATAKHAQCLQKERGHMRSRAGSVKRKKAAAGQGFRPGDVIQRR